MNNTELNDELEVVARESLLLYISDLIASFAGFLYWFIAAKIVSSTILGTASAIVSLSTIVVTASSLGLAMAILRIGSIYRNTLGSVSATAIVLGIGSLLLVSLISLPLLIHVLGSIYLFLFVVSLALFTLLISILRSTLIVIRAAKYLPYTQSIAAVARVSIGIGLLLILPSVSGVVGGYLIGLLASSLSLLLIALRRGFLRLRPSRRYVAELLRAGYPVWLPSIVMVLGTQLGVVFTYSLRGGSEAGYLYIAQTIALAADAARQAIARALIPSIATENIDRQRLGTAIRLTYALLLPINTALIFFPEPVLRLISSEYIAAANPLRIYAATNMVLAAIGLVTTYIYATGSYRYTLLINSTMSVTRVALYTALTPLYGATGAAIAYLAGALAASIPITARILREGIAMPWREMTAATSVSLAIGVGLSWLGQSITSTMIAVATMYVALLVLKIIRREEAVAIVKSLLRTR